MRLGALLLGLLATPAAAQGTTGYTIAYGIQLGDLQDNGVIERCEPNRSCEAKMRDGKTRLSVSVGARGDVTVSLHGTGRCCLFGNGDSFGMVTRERRVQHLPLFIGRTRQRNEVIQNVKVGDLYIALSR
jgi:hypothetical protein